MGAWEEPAFSILDLASRPIYENPRRLTTGIS